jgi:alkyl sulfatase BDS1-like metallo-beta-lactamase superfamily hydrolase
MTDLPFSDRSDFDNADRGHIASRTPGIVTNAQGQTVWDGDVFSFLSGECPPSVHPSLWRQSQLCAKQGLYEVAEGIYQVRGLDLSNETAAAALALYREHRGDRPVTGLLYTHSHIDHFGGAGGVLPPGNPEGVPILAPAGFTENAVAENATPEPRWHGAGFTTPAPPFPKTRRGWSAPDSARPPRPEPSP